MAIAEVDNIRAQAATATDIELFLVSMCSFASYNSNNVHDPNHGIVIYLNIKIFENYVFVNNDFIRVPELAPENDTSIARSEAKFAVQAPDCSAQYSSYTTETIRLTLSPEIE